MIWQFTSMVLCINQNKKYDTNEYNAIQNPGAFQQLLVLKVPSESSILNFVKLVSIVTYSQGKILIGNWKWRLVILSTE